MKPLLNIIFNRTSVREFVKGRGISEQIVRDILQAGINAPSAGNIQPRTFIIVQNQAVKERLYELCEEQAFMKDAPLWVVICVDLHRHLKAAKLTGVDYDYTGILPYTFGVLDAALSLENMVIAAEAMGLGSVIIGSIIEHPEKAKEILKLPRHCLVVAILCIGYPKEHPKKREKWSYGVIVCKDGYQAVRKEDVTEYWRRFITSELKRAGKETTRDAVEQLLKTRNYGSVYSTQYKEKFIRETNRKLTEFLASQGLIGKTTSCA